MRKKRKFFIGGFILFLALGCLSYSGFTAAATYYYTVSELAEQGNSIYGENVRVSGQVVVGSVEKEAAGRTLRFIVADLEETESLSVVYRGVVPDTFKVNSEVVVEGSLDSDGIFQANVLMAKCPSKYVPAE